MSATEAGESALRVTRFHHAERVGFIGTGSMGRPMIAKLLQAGYLVGVCDIDPAAANDVVEKGAGWRDLPRDADRDCEILITCLPMPYDVFDNLTGEQGALAGMPPGSVWIDTSTTDYHNTSEIARRAAAIGVYSLEAPVSNLSHMGVDFANVSFFVGGPSEAYMRSEVPLPTRGAVSSHVGDIGQSQSVKLLTNPLFYAPAVASGAVGKRYSQAGRKFDRDDNHLRVVELAQVAFGVRLQVSGYRAPSKYGADPAHPPEFLTDPTRTDQTETRACVSAPRRPAQRYLETLARVSGRRAHPRQSPDP